MGMYHSWVSTKREYFPRLVLTLLVESLKQLSFTQLEFGRFIVSSLIWLLLDLLWFLPVLLLNLWLGLILIFYSNYCPCGRPGSIIFCVSWKILLALLLLIVFSIDNFYPLDFLSWLLNFYVYVFYFLCFWSDFMTECYTIKSFWVSPINLSSTITKVTSLILLRYFSELMDLSNFDASTKFLYGS